MQLNILGYLSYVSAICCGEQYSLCCRRVVAVSYMYGNNVKLLILLYLSSS